MKFVTLIAILLALALCLGACFYVKDLNIFSSESEGLKDTESPKDTEDLDNVIVPEENYEWMEQGLFSVDIPPNIPGSINLENPKYYAFTLGEERLVKLDKNSTGLPHYIFKDQGALVGTHVACDLDGLAFSLKLEAGSYYLVCDAETEEKIFYLLHS